MKIEFSELLIEGVKHYRAKANFKINGKEHQANFQSKEPITKDFFIKEINQRLNANTKAKD
jgi:hypothetical protein